MGKRWLVVLGALGLGLLACTGGGSSGRGHDGPALDEPPPSPPPPPPPASSRPPHPEEVATALGPGERHPFTCCDTHSVQRVLEEYLDLHQALHTESHTKPAAQTYALQGVLKAAIKDTALPVDQRAIIGQLVTSLDSVKDGDLEQIRAEFAGISRHMLFLCFSHQGGGVEIAEAWCEDRPWLQRGEELQSPWEDKRCGEWR